MSRPVTANQKQEFHYLQKVEIYDFQTLARKICHIYMKIITRSTVHTSHTYKISPQSIIWPMTDWVDLGASTVVEFQVYRCSRMPLKSGTLLGYVKKPISEVAGNSYTTFSLMDNTSAGSKICSLNIFCSDRPRGPSSTIGMVFEAMEHIRLMPAMIGKVNPATILEGRNEVFQSDSVMQPVHDKEPARLRSDVIVEAPPAAQMIVADTAVEISDTSTTTRIEDENPVAMASDKTHYIRKVEVHGLGHSPMKYRIYLEITVGETPYMTSAYRMPSQSIPYWAHPINLGSHDDSIIVKFELFQNPKTPLMRKASLGSAEKKISDFPRSGDRTISLKMNNKPVSSLKVFFSNDIRRVTEGVVQDTPAPKTSLDGIGKLLDAMEPIEKVIDMIADAHPAAKIAWNVVSTGANLLRKKKETNEIITKLYVTMLSAFKDASRREILQNRKNLKSVYDALFQHTIECSIFIKGYVENESWAGRLPRAFLSGKAEEFCDGFQDLRDQLLSNIVAEDLAVTLAMLGKVEEIDMHQLLQDLRPWTSLGPKSTCMKGTRVATINYLMDWIADCNGGMMWCSGLAGTGKSSLVGTLHQLLTVHAGGRNRLGAFIRYDRIQYSDASHLITSIAYSLGMYDTRIGTTISTVLRRNRAVLSMAASSAGDQFRILLQEPLESLQDLANEGPLVIIIDGMDEGDASEEMLAVLSRGFGRKLPFIRLLVFSRPTESISLVFTTPNSAVTRFALDKASVEVNKDIRYYIQARFNAIPSDVAFEKACKELDAIDGLAQRASGLFIWAATVCLFIKEFPCINRLRVLLSSDVPIHTTDSLTTLYKTALDTIVSEFPGRNDDIKKCVLAVLGAVIFARTPPGMKPKYLNIVLSPEDPNPRLVLAKLGSVLQTNEESGGFIQLIHKSFDDFLTNPSRCGERWFIDVEDQKRKFARQWLLSLTDFLASWQPNFDIPTHIRDYALIAPLWHIECFNIHDIDAMRVLFQDQFYKWLQATFIADKYRALLHERVNIMIWVSRLPIEVDNSFRLLTFRACQNAELELIPRMREEPPIGPFEAQVHWNNNLPYAPQLVTGPTTPRFSVSADSQFLVATQSVGNNATIMLWPIHVVFQERPTPKPISSFFNLEESLKNSQYDALGCLVTRSAVADYRSVIDSNSNSQAHWEVIGRYSDAALANESTSAFISIHDVQTSCSHHYVFRGLKTYDLLLYATGIIIIDTQALVLMRIDMNTTDQGVPRLWIRVSEGDALQLEYTSLRSSDDSSQHSDDSSGLEYDFFHTLRKGQFVVSKDGLTLAYLQHQSDDDRRTFRCWSTTTGTILFTQEITSFREISANATTFSITTQQNGKLFLQIIPSETDNTGDNMAPLQVDFAPRPSMRRLAVFSNERKIAYVTTEDMFILDVQAKKNIFRHPFPYGGRFRYDVDERPSDIVVTPDGKNLLTVHPWIIRIWHVDVL